MKKLALLALPVCLLTACGGSSSTATTTSTTVSTQTTAPAVQKYTLTVGTNSGPDKVVTFPVDSQVELTVINPNSDDEVHLHGYDIGTGELKKGEEAVIAFTADKAGDFEVESHVTEKVLLIVRIAGNG